MIYTLMIQPILIFGTMYVDLEIIFHPELMKILWRLDRHLNPSILSVS